MHLETVKLASDLEVGLVVPLLGTGIAAIGLVFVKYADAVARFFRGMGDNLWGQRASAQIYTAKGARLGGWGFVGFGCLLVLVAAIVLIARHV